MPTALITGNRGFIGSHLQNYLIRNGYYVLGIDNNFHPCRNYVNGNIGDIRNKELINEYVKLSDIVFHLGAIIHVDYSIKYPQETIDININGTLNVLEACRKYNKKLVFASSSEVYGTSQSEFMDETHPLDAQSPYAASKVAGDRLCKSYIDTYGMDICILRNFNTFGPYQDDGQAGKSYGAVIGIFTKSALNGNPIRIFGDGEQRRDYMFITDVLRGYEIASRYIGVLNIGSGKTVSINEIASKVKEITGSKSEIVHVEPRPGEVKRLCADISKARTLGFEPETDFDKHLKQYIDWYKEEYEQHILQQGIVVD